MILYLYMLKVTPSVHIILNILSWNQSKLVPKIRLTSARFVWREGSVARDSGGTEREEETQVSNTHHEKCQFHSEIGK